MSNNILSKYPKDRQLPYILLGLYIAIAAFSTPTSLEMKDFCDLTFKGGEIEAFIYLFTEPHGNCTYAVLSVFSIISAGLVSLGFITLGIGKTILKKRHRLSEIALGVYYSFLATSLAIIVIGIFLSSEIYNNLWLFGILAIIAIIIGFITRPKIKIEKKGE